MAPDWRSLLRVVDFFLPLDIITAVVAGGLAVFAVENLLDAYIRTHVPEQHWNVVWFLVAVSGVIILSLFNLMSADKEEIDELEEEIDDVLNGEEKV